MWLRCDFSLAVTGFICASAPEIEEEFKKDSVKSVKERRRDRAQPYGSPPYDPELEVSEDEYFSSPWSEGELITEGLVNDDFWNGDNETGCVAEDLLVSSMI